MYTVECCNNGEWLNADLYSQHYYTHLKSTQDEHSRSERQLEPAEK